MSKSKKNIITFVLIIFIVAILLAIAAKFYKKNQHPNCITVQKIEHNASRISQTNLSTPNTIETKNKASSKALFSNASSLQNFIQLENAFDTMFQQNIHWVDNFFSSANPSFFSSSFQEQPKQYVYTVNLPGFDPKHIHINIQNNLLVINAQNASHNQFSYQFLLPAMANADHIVAKAKNGVLTIVIPKATQMAATKHIIVQEG